MTHLFVIGVRETGREWKGREGGCSHGAGGRAQGIAGPERVTGDPEHGTGGVEQRTAGPEPGGPDQGTAGPEQGTAGPEQRTGGPEQRIPPFPKSFCFGGLQLHPQTPGYRAHPCGKCPKLLELARVNPG